MNNMPWVRLVLWILGVLLVVLLAFIAFLYFKFQPAIQPTTSNLASVDCGAFKIELKEWVSNDLLTGRHVQRYFWYNPNGFLNGGKKISDDSSFPSMYAPEDFLLFDTPKEFSGLHLVLYEPSSDMPASMTRMELNSSHSRNGFGYFNREEYVAVRDCLLNNRKALAVSVRYPDVRNGGEFTANLLPLSVSLIPVRKKMNHVVRVGVLLIPPSSVLRK